MLAAALVALLLAGGCSLGEPEVRDERLVFPYAQGIFYLMSFGSKDDVDQPSWFEKWIIGPDAYSDDGIIEKPYGVAVAKGKVYVNDGRTKAGFWEFDLASWKMHLIRDRSLSGTTGIAVDGRGYKYIVGPQLLEAKAKGTIWTKNEEGRIVVFDEANRKVREAQLPGRPIGVDLWDDRLYVTDLVNHRVMIVDKQTLELVGHFGKGGQGEGELQMPKGIDLGGDGRVYVSDSLNGRIEVFTRDGDFVAQYGHRAQVLGSFLFLSGLAADREGRVYAVDSGHFSKFKKDEVQIFDSSRFYLKGEVVPPLDAALETRKNALLGYFEKPFGVGRPEDAGAVRRSAYQPVDIAIDYANVDYFREFVPEGFQFEYLVWLTSQSAYSGKNLSVFAYATKK